MKKIVVSMLVTLDGVMEAPGGEPSHPHTGWAHEFMGEQEVRYKLVEVLEADSLLIGRITYESFAEGWSKGTGIFADRMNSMPKHVVSRTLKRAEWTNSTVIDGDIFGRVRKLKEGEGGPIVVAGSRTLVHALMEHDLVDEYRLMIFPVAVGSGRRLFPDTSRKTRLRLAESLTFSSGVVVQTYCPETPAAQP